MQNKLINRFILPSAITIILVILIAAFSIISFIRQTAINNAEKEINQLMQTTVNNLDLIYSENTGKLSSALILLENKLQNAGSPELRNNRISLVNNNGIELQKYVDSVSSIFNCTATVFYKKNKDFIRQATSIRDKEGKRITGSKLEYQSPAYENLLNDKTYEGFAYIFEKMFLTKYVPLENEAGEVIGSVYAGISLENMKFLKHIIEQTEILKRGFSALTGPNEEIIFVSKNTTKEKASKIIDKYHTGSEITDFSVALENYKGIRIYATYNKDDINASLKNIFIGIAIIISTLLLGNLIVIYILLKKNIIEPVNEIKIAANNLSKGNFEMTITPEEFSDDEIGQLYSAFSRINKSLENVFSEILALQRSAQFGILDKRGKTEKFEGKFKDLVEEFNNVLDTLIKPINLSSEYVERISKGDIPEKITENFRGDYREVKKNLNILIDVYRKLTNDINYLMISASEGDLSARADESKHLGNYREMIKGLNRALDLLLEPVKEAVSVLRKMSEGNLSVRMQGDYKGDHGILKDAINDTLESLPFKEASDVLKKFASGDMDVRMNGSYVGENRIFAETLNQTLGKRQEVQKYYEALFSAHPDMLIITGHDFIIKEHKNNQYFLFVSNYNLKGQNILDHLPFNAIEEFKEKFYKALDSNTLEIFEFQYGNESTKQDIEIRFSKISDSEIFVIFRDITEKQDLLRKTKHLFNILESVALQSKNIIKTENIEKEFDKILEVFGNVLDVDRSFIGVKHINDDKESIKIKYEWTNTDVHPVEDKDYHKSYGKEGKFREIFKKLENNEIVDFNKESLDDKIKSALETQDIKSLIIFPLIVDNDLWGVLGFQNVKDHKKWSDEEVHAISVSKELIASTISDNLDKQRIYENDIFMNSVIENLPACVYVKNANDFSYLIWNKTTENITGIKAEDIKGKDDFEVMPEELSNHMRAQDQKVLELGRTQKFPFEKLYFNEEEIIFNTIKTPVFDRNKNIKYILGISDDITDLVYTKDALNKSEEKFRTIFNESPIGIFKTSLEGNLIEVNSSMAKILGYQNSRELFDYIKFAEGLYANPEDRKIIIKSLFNEDKAVKYEVPMRKKNGEIIFVKINARSVKENSEIYFIGQIEDISRQINTKKELEANYKFLETLIETIPSPIYYKEASARKFIGYNKAFAEFFGLSKENILGKRSEDIHPPELAQIYNQKDDEILKTGGSQVFEGKAESKSKGSKIIIVNKSCYYDKNNNISGFVGVINDITDVRKAETELKQYAEEIEYAKAREESNSQHLAELVEKLDKANKKAEEASKLKSEFIANMSHEIRTPMNSILGFTEILLNNIKEEPYRDQLNIIYKSGTTLLALINDILDISKIEADKLELNLEPVNFDSLLNEIKQMFSQKTDEKNIKLIIDNDDKIPSQLMLDEIRFRQILFNLVGNAVKFTEEGYIKIVSNLIKIDNDYADFNIKVIDTGIGIPKDKQQIVFEAFMQKDSDNKRKYSGTGLGLTIVKKLMDKMDAELIMESEVGEGTTFTLKFKNMPTKPWLVSNIDDKYEDKVTFKENSLVYIFDKYDSITNLKSFLEDEKINVKSTSKQESVFDDIIQLKPSIIIFHIKLHGKDYYSLAAELRRNDKTNDIPLIAYTDSSILKEDKRIKRYFDDLIIYPAEKNDLMFYLSKYLPHNDLSSINGEEPLNLNIEDISFDKIQKKEELKEILNNTLFEKYNKLTKVLMINKANDFANDLKALSIIHDFDELEFYSNLLIDNIDKNNIPNIRKILNKFPSIVNNFNNLFDTL